MTVLEDRYVKSTRKPWQCDGCGRRFDAGTSKRRQRVVGDDGPYTWTTCTTCQRIMRELLALDPEYRYEGVSSENIFESMVNQFGSWEAADAHYASSNLEEIVNGK